MLEWSPPQGLDDAVEISGITEWRNAYCIVGAVVLNAILYWIVGSTDESAALWRSEDGRSWEMAAMVPIAPTQILVDVVVWDDQLVIATSPSTWIPAGAGFLLAYDGEEWSEHRVESGDAARPDVSPEDLIVMGDRLVVRGVAWPETPDVLPYLDPLLQDLVASGDAVAYQSHEGIHVILLPLGIEIARISNQETELPPPSEIPPEPLAWAGTDLDELQIESSIPRSVAPLSDGRLVGVPNVGLAISEDGETWEETGDHLGQIESLAPWRGGVIVTTAGAAPVYWIPGGEPSALLPPGLWEQVSFSPPPLTGSWGIALALFRTPEQPLGASSPDAVIPVKGGELHVSWGNLRLVRDGTPVWTEEIWEIPVEIVSEGELLLGATPDQIEVGIEELEAAANSLDVFPMQVDVLHSPHGGIWSSTPWTDIIGSETAGNARLFAVDDFLLAVDSLASFGGTGRVDSVRIGTLKESG